MRALRAMSNRSKARNAYVWISCHASVLLLFFGRRRWSSRIRGSRRIFPLFRWTRSLPTRQKIPPSSASRERFGVFKRTCSIHLYIGSQYTYIYCMCVSCCTIFLKGAVCIDYLCFLYRGLSTALSRTRAVPHGVAKRSRCANG